MQGPVWIMVMDAYTMPNERSALGRCWGDVGVLGVEY